MEDWRFLHPVVRVHGLRRGVGVGALGGLGASLILARLVRPESVDVGEDATDGVAIPGRHELVDGDVPAAPVRAGPHRDDTECEGTNQNGVTGALWPLPLC